LSILASATDVLRIFAAGEQEIGVATLVQRLGWPKSTSSRVLAQMADHGLLQRDREDRQYRLGVLVRELGQAQRQSQQPARQQIGAALMQLCARTGHTAHLSVLDGTDSVLLEHFAGSNVLQVMSPVGSRLPASVMAIGRALLSRLPDAEFRARYGDDDEAPLPPSPPRCPQTVGALAKRVQQARRERSAIAINEGLPDVAAVATTLWDPAARVTLGMALSFPARQLATAQALAKQFRRDLMALAGTIGHDLGDPWWSAPHE
jgi:DNA-binding IclR family transcriptional regulator